LEGPSVALGFGGTAGGGGTASYVEIDNSGAISTTGNDAHGIVAQSIGGGGGTGGLSIAGSLSQDGTLSASFGGDGGNGNTAGAVDVFTSNIISTTGTH